MPKELVAIAPRKPLLVEYEEPPLKPNQIRIKSCFSAEKHGTTLLIYRGLSPFSKRSFDPETGLFMPKRGGKGWSTSFPIKLGNMTVGIVIEVGSQVKKFKKGTEFMVICQSGKPTQSMKKTLTMRLRSLATRR